MLTFSNLGVKGGLGNQLFQFASLVGIAKSQGYDWGFPARSRAGTVPQILEYFEMSDYWQGSHDSYLVSNPKYYSRINRFRDSTGVRYDSRLHERIRDNFDIDAYLQSEKYFLGHEQYVRSQLIVKREYSLKSSLIVEPYIGIHVRRGDYKRLRHTHSLLNLNYYEQALGSLPKINKVICTDDVDWVLSQRLFAKSDCIVVSSSSIEDFQILKGASYHIIANSSFSWWAAWLSESKFVIAPKKWFGWAYPPSASKDLIPDRWVRI